MHTMFDSKIILFYTCFASQNHHDENYFFNKSRLKVSFRNKYVCHVWEMSQKVLQHVVKVNLMLRYKHNWEPVQIKARADVMFIGDFGQYSWSCVAVNMWNGQPSVQGWNRC